MNKLDLIMDFCVAVFMLASVLLFHLDDRRIKTLESHANTIQREFNINAFIQAGAIQADQEDIKEIHQELDAIKTVAEQQEYELSVITEYIKQSHPH